MSENGLLKVFLAMCKDHIFLKIYILKCEPEIITQTERLNKRLSYKILLYIEVWDIHHSWYIP